MFRKKKATVFGEVSEVEQLTPGLRRVTLVGGTLHQFPGSEFTDAYISAQFLPPGSPIEVPFEQRGVAGVAREHQPYARRLTIRRWDPDAQSLAIDFVSHGDAGFAGSWANRVQAGDRLQFAGPGGSYRPSAKVDWHLMVGDESAFGAIGASLESLPEDHHALVVAVVDEPGHEVLFPSKAKVTLNWVYRVSSEAPEALLMEAVKGAVFPDGSFDVFVHGEAEETRAVRRHLIVDRGVDPKKASISPYWRRGLTDEDWRTVKRQWMAEQAKDA
ncbi:MAG: siderophore-interacting protein [Planctomycetota bacterium]